MNTVQSIPQPVVAKVHALATAAGTPVRGVLRSGSRRRERQLRDTGRQGRACSATRRSSQLLATSAASGRWRWPSPATRSMPRRQCRGASSTTPCPTTSSTRAVHDLLSRATRGSVAVEGGRQARLLCADRARPDRRLRLCRRPDVAIGHHARRPGGDRRVPREATSYLHRPSVAAGCRSIPLGGIVRPWIRRDLDTPTTSNNCWRDSAASRARSVGSGA